MNAESLLSSQEETIFGTFLERLAVFVAETVCRKRGQAKLTIHPFALGSPVGAGEGNEAPSQGPATAT